MRPVILSIVFLGSIGIGSARAQAWGDTATFGKGITHVAERGSVLQLDFKTPVYGVLVRLVDGRPWRVLDIRDYPPGLNELKVPMVVAERGGSRTYRSGATTTGGDQAAVEARAVRDNAACNRAMDPSRGSAPRAGQPTPVNLAAPCYSSGTPDYLQPRSTTIREPATVQRDHLLLIVSNQLIDTALVAQRLAAAVPFPSADSAAKALPALLTPEHAAWAEYMIRRR